MYRLLILIVLLSLLVTPPVPAAPPDVPGSLPPPPQIEWGTPMVGNGQIQTFVIVVPSEEPQYLDVYFRASLLEGLPQHPPSDGRWDVLYGDGQVWYCYGYETVLDFPPLVAAMPFQHVVLNWNSHDHIPPGLYVRLCIITGYSQTAESRLWA